MNMCHDDHEEIVFDGRRCPLCEAISERDREISMLKDDVARLEQEVRDLEREADGV